MTSDRFRVAVITADDELWESTRRRLDEHQLVPKRLLAPLGREGRKLAERADAVLVDEREVDVTAAIDAWLRAGWIDRGCPVMVVTPDPPERERQLEWLRGGAWGVLRTPVDGEMLAVQLGTQLRSTRSDDNGQPAQTPPPYIWTTFVRATEETLALARRYGRSVSCIGVELDWAEGPGHASARGVIDRLTRPAQLVVRRYDLVGVSRSGLLLMVLPDTSGSDAIAFRDRLLPFLEDHLRGWGVLGRLQAGVATTDGGDWPESATEFLLSASRTSGRE